MKSKMKRQGATALPRFVVGALATAGASAANGATVQITFDNNVVSSTNGLANFAPDLTGDTVNELDAVFSADRASVWRAVGEVMVGRAMYVNTYVVSFGMSTFVRASVFGLGNTKVNSGAAVKEGLVQILFSDSQINNGEITRGWLDVEAQADFDGERTVQIHRLIFDNASTTAPTGVAYTDADYPEWGVAAVPEPGSNLALLALGAGGLTLRRRLKRAA
jgi:hypothetical protein